MKRCASVLIAALSIATAALSAHADLLYENYTPGTTDYNTTTTYDIRNSLPVYVYSYDVGVEGNTRELSFRFTADTAIVPRHAFVPLHDTVSQNTSSDLLRVDLYEIGPDNRHWFAAGNIEPMLNDGQTGELKVYFSNNASTPSTRIGYEYEVVITAHTSYIEAFLSNTASINANYHTAKVTYLTYTVYNDLNTPLGYEPAISIHGDLVPEPASAALLLCGGACVLQGRRTRRDR